MIVFSRTRQAQLTALSALALLTAAGCSHNDTPPPTVSTNTTVTPPATTGTATTTPTAPGAVVTSATPSTNNTNAGAGGATGTQTDVADAVNKAIHNNAQMTGSRVTAVVNTAGEARLTGTAQNQQQKALAESTARQTSGVSSVINKIEIVPTGGVKSAAVHTVVKEHTKIVVVHDQAPAPASTDSTSAPANGSTDSTTDTKTDTNTPSSTPPATTKSP